MHLNVFNIVISFSSCASFNIFIQFFSMYIFDISVNIFSSLISLSSSWIDKDFAILELYQHLSQLAWKYFTLLALFVLTTEVKITIDFCHYCFLTLSCYRFTGIFFIFCLNIPFCILEISDEIIFLLHEVYVFQIFLLWVYIGNKISSFLFIWKCFNFLFIKESFSVCRLSNIFIIFL